MDKNRELAYKLHRDIDKHVSSLSAKSEENKALSTRVVTLEKDVGLVLAVPFDLPHVELLTAAPILRYLGKFDKSISIACQIGPWY